MDVLVDLLTACFNFLIGPVLSVIGFVLTVKGIQMQKSSKTIDWSQMHAAAKHMKKYVKEYKPDVIICPGQKGGIFAQLIVNNNELSIPIYTGFMVDIQKTISENLTDNYFNIDTTKWHVFLPAAIKSNIDSKILIVDDYVMSGDFLLNLKIKLLEFGYKPDNIKSCSIVTTKVAQCANKAPDYYWKIVEADDCYFPWGKAI